jgi:putative mRNA 3-end processing factor
VLDATYGLPVFRWAARDLLGDALRSWRALNADAGRAMLLCAEPTDEALTLLDLLGPETFAHPEIEALARRSGRAVQPLPARAAAKAVAGKVVLAPRSELETPTLKLGPHETALASGRMRVRGNRRRLAIDRGFALSSRADWPMLLRAVEARADAKVRLVGTHAGTLARLLTERGRDASVLA